MYCLANLLFFDILLYYYTNLNSSIFFGLFVWRYRFFFGISTSSLASLFYECSSLEEFLEMFVILSAILLRIKSPVASAGFWITFFEAVFIASVIDFLAVSRCFWLYLLLRFLATLVACVPMFLAKDKNL